MSKIIVNKNSSQRSLESLSGGVKRILKDLFNSQEGSSGKTKDIAMQDGEQKQEEET